MEVKIITDLVCLTEEIKKSNFNIELKMKFLDDNSNKYYTEIIKSYLSDCGCYHGKIGAILTFVIISFTHFFHIDSFSLQPFWVITIVASFIGAIMGKFIRLIQLRIKLKNTIRKLGFHKSEYMKKR